MKVIGVNGSPRKGWNTATLLNKALEGAASQGAETELVHLYDLNYKGCKSCFSCKEKGGKSYGRCSIRDELAPILDKVQEADAIILGSPIYFGAVTGEMRSFLERLLFPYTTYTDPPGSLFSRRINIGLIYTMNVTEERMRELGYDKHCFSEMALKRLFGAIEAVISYDTYQFEDYSKVVASKFDPQAKAKRREDVFPIDCREAFDMGVRFARE